VRAITLGFHDVLDVHRVAPGAVYTVRLRDFKCHLRAISEQNPQVRTIQESCYWREEVPVFITFDDGTVGAYIFAAAALEEYGWRGHFFLTTDWIGRNGYMDRQHSRFAAARSCHRKPLVLAS